MNRLSTFNIPNFHLRKISPPLLCWARYPFEFGVSAHTVHNNQQCLRWECNARRCQMTSMCVTAVQLFVAFRFSSSLLYLSLLSLASLSLNNNVSLNFNGSDVECGQKRSLRVSRRNKPFLSHVDDVVIKIFKKLRQNKTLVAAYAIVRDCVMSSKYLRQIKPLKSKPQDIMSDPWWCMAALDVEYPPRNFRLRVSP